MYTELVLGMEIKNHDEAIQILKYMLGGEAELPTERKHEFFNTKRWKYMLVCDSYYFDGQTDSKLFFDELDRHNPTYYLNVRCNLKNYDCEIEKFLDWLCPHIKSIGFLGYKRYEGTENPTLIYKTEKGIEYKDVKGE